MNRPNFIGDLIPVTDVPEDDLVSVGIRLGVRGDQTWWRSTNERFLIDVITHSPTYNITRRAVPDIFGDVFEF